MKLHNEILALRYYPVVKFYFNFDHIYLCARSRFPRPYGQSNPGDLSRSRYGSRILCASEYIPSCKIPSAICRRCACYIQGLANIPARSSRVMAILWARRLWGPELFMKSESRDCEWEAFPFFNNTASCNKLFQIIRVFILYVLYFVCVCVWWE